MMTVFKHLWRAYRPVYFWFWGIMAVVLAGISLSFEIFGNYTLDDKRVSVWETVGQQGPRWFLFVMGLMFVTVNLPVVVASGLTRRAHFRGAMAFTVASAAAFTVALLLGFAVERAVYTANGMMATLKSPYPIDSWAQAGEYALDAFLPLLAFMLSGWIVGLLFYRMRVWLAILLAPIAVFPISGVSIPLDENWALYVALVTIAGALVVGWLLIRTVPIRAKKA